MKSLIKSVLCIISLVASILIVPPIHRLWLRNKIERQVVRITNEALTSGGTGVHIKLPSGKVAILTNSHICHLKDAEGNLWIAEDGQRAIPRKVIEDSNFTDLCLVQPLEKHNGLSLASGIYSGEVVSAVGHPTLMPITMTSGEIIFEGDAYVLDHMGEDHCDAPKNVKIPVSVWGMAVMACAVHIKADFTTVHILPGSSGSPVVNGFGNIVGLMFAGDSEIHWGLMVTLVDIHKLIALY
jgi:S1-C subfamily serine protease